MQIKGDQIRLFLINKDFHFSLRSLLFWKFLLLWFSIIHKKENAWRRFLTVAVVKLQDYFRLSILACFWSSSDFIKLGKKHHSICCWLIRHTMERVLKVWQNTHIFLYLTCQSPTTAEQLNRTFLIWSWSLDTQLVHLNVNFTATSKMAISRSLWI